MTHNNINPDDPGILINHSKYYTISDFNNTFKLSHNSYSSHPKNNNSDDNTSYNPLKDFSLFHWNARSLNKNFDSFELLLHSLQNFPFSAIGISETWLGHKSPNLFNLDNYKIFRSDRLRGRGGGVALYIFNQLRVKIRTDIYIEGCESLFVEIINDKTKNRIIGVIYRPPNNKTEIFLENFDECLNSITRENKEIYIMGDYNIDMTKVDTLAVKLKTTLFSYAFNPHIDNPTRISQTSKSLLDNIFSNNSSINDFENGILYYDISDHLPIFIILRIYQENMKRIPNPKPSMYRKESDDNIVLLESDLAKEKWHEVYLQTNADKAYDSFQEKLLYYYRKNIPLVKKKTRRKNKHPWITMGILNSIKTRNKLYKQAITSQNARNLKDYKKYRNILSSLIRTSRKMYYSNKFEKQKNDINGLWETINDITGKNNKENSSIFINDNKELTNPDEIADAFNSYFTNIGPQLATKIRNKHVNSNFSKFLPPKFEKSLFFTPTDEEEVLKIVRCLKPSRSSGHDEISVNLLKKIILQLTKPLTYIFNISLSSGKCPNSLKIAKVVPVFKRKDDASLLTNYRPISLLPSISKILEKIIHKRLYIFLQVNGLLIPNQFGFRKGHSTDLAIIQLLDKITESFANKEHLIGIFMDLSKAFDTIDHDILIYKLKRYGVRGLALSWIIDYLSNRKQYVLFKSSKSHNSNIICGVPQGSILGPLLFLIYQ